MGKHHWMRLSHIRLTERLFTLVMLLLYLFSIGIFTFTTYKTRQAELLSSTRTTLFTTAMSVEHIIGLGFGERFQINTPPDPQIYRYIVNKLTSWVDTLPVTYVYLVDKVGDDVYFVISNETPKDKANGTLSTFYNQYSSAPQALIDSFDRDEPTYSNVYQNDWGHFQSVFVPVKREDSSVYILAADIEVESFNKILIDSAIQSTLLAILFLFPLIPMFFLYVRLNRRKEKEFKRSLFYDSVTGVANSHRLREDLYHSEESFSGILLCLVDTDDINTVFGRTATDTLFTYIGKELQKKLPIGANLYRVRVREFFVLYDELSEDKVINLTHELLTILNTSLPISSSRSDQTHIAITSHAGVVVNVKKQRLVSRARGAMESAMDLGKPFCFFEGGLEREQQIETSYYWQKEVSEALEDGRIIPYFQPIYDNQKNTVTRYEMLVRLIDSSGRVISPDSFLPAIKRSFLYRKLTHSMIEQGFSIFSQRKENMTINLCKSDLLDAQTPSFLLEAIERYGMTGKVTIEVVESDWIGFQDEVLEVLCFLKASGLYIAIDDFGSGYSNFDQLLKMDVDYLKIDGSLISRMFTNDQALSMIKAIIALANGLDIPVIAEYVETKLMLDRLKVLGCEFSQGYIIGKPIPAETLAASGEWTLDEHS